jgi:glutaredoxin
MSMMPGTLYDSAVKTEDQTMINQTQSPTFFIDGGEPAGYSELDMYKL